MKDINRRYLAWREKNAVGFVRENTTTSTGNSIVVVISAISVMYKLIIHIGEVNYENSF